MEPGLSRKKAVLSRSQELGGGQLLFFAAFDTPASAARVKLLRQPGQSALFGDSLSPVAIRAGRPALIYAIRLF